MSTNCSDGFASDNFLRVPMPYGPFHQAPGSDCFLHVLAFEIIAWILIAVSFAMIAVLCATFRVRKHSLKIGLAPAGQILMLTSIIALLLCALFAPIYCFAAWFVFCLFLFLWAGAHLNTLVGAKMNLMRSLSPSTSATEVVGGKLVVAIMIISLLCGFLGVMVGGLGCAILYPSYYYNVHNTYYMELILHFWALHCASWAISVFFLISFAFLVLGKFASIIEAIVNETPVSNGGIQQNNDVLEVARRMRETRKNMFFTLPLGFGAWVLHSCILPVFWYILILHLCNGFLGVAITWIMHTPQKYRSLAFRTALCPCRRIVRLDSHSSKMEGSSKDRAGGSAPTVALRFTRTAASGREVTPKDELSD